MVTTEATAAFHLTKETSNVVAVYYHGRPTQAQAVSDAIAYIEAEVNYYSNKSDSESDATKRKQLEAHTSNLGGLLITLGRGNNQPAHKAFNEYGDALYRYGQGLNSSRVNYRNQRQVQAQADEYLLQGRSFMNLGESLLPPKL